MSIKIFADGADVKDMLQAYRSGAVHGFTTNPTLMRKAGISDYTAFAKDVLAQITDMPISFEVFADDLPTMVQQAKLIQSWGKNVYVKIPVTNTKGESTLPAIAQLAQSGVQLNVTAVFTVQQASGIIEALESSVPSVVSIFGGRIANAGTDPIPIMTEAVALAKKRPQCEVLWASPREAFNIIQAERCGCHIITVTTDLLAAMKTFGKNLEQYSLETVQMFYNDAQQAGYTL